MDIPDKRPFLLDGISFIAPDNQGMPDPDELAQQTAEYIAAGSHAVLVPCPDETLVQAVTAVAGGRVPVGGIVPLSDIDIVPFGRTTFERLVAFYRDKLRVYAGLSFVYLDGFTSIADLRAALLAARSFSLPVLAAMEIGDDCRTTLRDADVLAALITAQSLGAAAFGVTAAGGIAPLVDSLRRLYPYASVPLIARVDAGSPNPVLPHLYDLSPQSMAFESVSLLRAGAQIIGGRYGVMPAHIRAMKTVVQDTAYTEHLPQKSPAEGELLAANHKEAFFLPEAPEISPPLYCTLDMSEALIEAADTSGIDVIAVMVTSIDDAHLLAENAHMAALPILVHCDDEASLEQALLHYQGRALVDSQSFIPPNRLAEIAARYGGIIY